MTFPSSIPAVRMRRRSSREANAQAPANLRRCRQTGGEGGPRDRARRFRSRWQDQWCRHGQARRGQRHHRGRHDTQRSQPVALKWPKLNLHSSTLTVANGGISFAAIVAQSLNKLHRPIQHRCCFQNTRAQRCGLIHQNPFQYAQALFPLPRAARHRITNLMV